MKFVDEATVSAEAGDGGPGARSFRREAYVPRGGPDGGDGGRGGSIIAEASTSKRTLLDFTFQPKWKAGDGKPGGGSGRTGADGDDVVWLLPVGTQIYRVNESTDSPTLVADLTEPSQRVVVLKGGRGGKGNKFFKSATNQVPDHAQPGEKGESGSFLLSLKLLADVALVGFPNAGKSTFISRISSAKPKIADYPFTTLQPNLGVVKLDGGGSLVVADIPGLIEGAHHGKGLGIQFLKHIERCRAAAYLLSIVSEEGELLSTEALREQLKMLMSELAHYSEELAAKPAVVLLTKTDLSPDYEAEKEIFHDLPFSSPPQVVPISSVSGTGIPIALKALKKLCKD